MYLYTNRSRKGQWFLISAVVFIFIFSAWIYLINQKTSVTDIQNENEVLLDAQYLVSSIFYNGYTPDQDSIKDLMLLSYSMLDQIGKERGFNSYLLCFCVDNGDFTVFNAFNESVTLNISTGKSSSTIFVDKYEFGKVNVNISDTLNIIIDVWDAEICVNQSELYGGFCGCILSFNDEKTTLFGKTLNLNWC